jgi:hypothetical protein
VLFVGVDWAEDITTSAAASERGCFGRCRLASDLTQVQPTGNASTPVPHLARAMIHRNRSRPPVVVARAGRPQPEAGANTPEGNTVTAGVHACS